MSNIACLVRAGRYEELALLVRREFGVTVDVLRLRDACLFAGDGWRSDARMWLKNRLDDMGCFRPGGERTELVEQLLVELHVFFIGIEENEEHLARLRGEHLSAEEKRQEKTEPKDSLARSRVFTTAEVVHPIDRVAARVAPEGEPGKEK